MNRRQVILTAILGMGVIPKVKNIFSQMFIDELLKRQVQNVGSTEKAASFWELIKNQFIFENEMYYFNQASLGTSPLTVIIATDTFRRKLETYPSKYMWGGWDDQIDLVRQQAAELLNAEQDEIALIHNTTEGMNVVAASLKLNPGDEVIVGNHEHRTATSPWLYHQEKKGVKIVRPELPMMPNRSNDILDVYRNAISDKTKVISMVHLTNTNGMILPVKEICAMAREKGIFTVIDGAQSMGVIPCDMAEIGCDFFTASGHKWVYAPKGIGIFYARKNVQKWLQPFIANRYYDQPGLKKIEDYNTRNLPDLLGLGSALAFHKMAGASSIFDRLLYLRNRFIDGIKNDARFKIKTPLSEGLSHQLVAIEKVGMNVDEFKDKLFDAFKIDVRGMSSHDLNAIRISFAIYHLDDDVDYLIKALKAI